MSNKRTRSFYIVGNETTFTKHFIARLREYDKHIFNYDFEVGDWTNFLIKSTQKSFDAVIVEVYSNEDKVNQNLETTLFFKKSESFKHIPFIALTNHNDKFIVDFSLLYRIGFSYVHIYGDSIKLLCSNLYYIIYEDESYSERWAMAKGFELKANVYHPALIKTFNEESVQILSDLQLKDYNDISMNFFNDFTPIGFDTLEGFKAKRVEGEFEQSLFIKFSDSWQTEGSPFFQDSLESWISLKLESNEIQYDYSVNLQLYSSNTSFYTEHFKGLSCSNTRHFHKFSKDHQFNEERSSDLIIYKINNKDELDDFEKMMIFLSEEYKYKPIVIVVNHPSFSEALQKLFNYEHLISCKEDTFNKLFIKMIKILEKKKSNFSSCYKASKLKDSYLASLPIEVKITSLTENEITFKTETELPFYTNLKLDLPIPGLNITIVPPYFELSPNIHGFHYMGIINAVSETQRQNLRRIVSHFMANHPKELTLIDVNYLNRSQEVEDKKEMEELKAKYKKQKEEKKQTKNAPKNNLKRSKSKEHWSKL